MRRMWKWLLPCALLLPAGLVVAALRGWLPPRTALTLTDTARLLSRSVLNPLTLHIAGRRVSPYAVLLHTGRKSGRAYRTPLLVRRVASPGGYVVALTYGERTDWYRNALAAGGCVMRWQGRSYRLGPPRVLGAEAGAAFSPVQRAGLGALGIRQFAAFDVVG